FRQSQFEIGRLERVLRTNEVLLSSLKDMEAGQRGFLLTGDRKYLEPYIAAKAALSGNFDALRDAVGQSAQKAKIDEIRPLIRDKIAEVEATLMVQERLGN